MSAPADRTVRALAPWDTEWAAERAAEALRYLGTHYPECLDALRVLDEHETAAHEAAMRGVGIGTLTSKPSEPTCVPAGMPPCGYEGLRRETLGRRYRVRIVRGLETGQRPWVARRPYDGPETL